MGKAKTKFPTIDAVAYELRSVNEECLYETEVRLQVYPNGDWAIRVGDPGYDQDHHGFWGAAMLPGYRKRFNSRDLARALLSEAKDQAYAEDAYGG